MPTVYLSPSTQDFNMFVTGDGSEEYFMNMIADAMIPYLQQFGIDYYRNTPEMTAGSSLRDSNSRDVDFHIAIHSNASGPGQEGRNRGVIVFYYPTSTNGQRMANIMVDNFREVYPLPNEVRAVATTSLGEVSRTSAPSVLIEVAYHDNVEDANWIENNIDTIARTLAESVNEFFAGAQPEVQPEMQPGAARTGRVTLSSGYLNIRNGPSLNAPVIGMAPNGTVVTVTEQVGDWYRVLYNGTDGYVSRQYITIQ
ncbi:MULTISPECIES: SH3 domain-containing protein [unclassified Sedimentibacter]|uniref:SH3 domain-containing protein n=1 Tax=unclassified Sedimentibacter TaxID=2649220 RepID=UPI0027DF55BE|nr:SH3 domain-containing protein [Sedimentibacter sp. MB35-C1]WMJ75891.1 SH3 domain-containing protein [Sedimentibacter sp. MB35-C1]